MDKYLVSLALKNVICNAIENSPPESPIILEVSLEEDNCKISCADEGPGIDAHFLPLIFDKFYRIPGSPSKGVGLGLPIVQAIIEIHQGSLHIENRKPHGMLFQLIFPVKNLSSHS